MRTGTRGTHQRCIETEAILSAMYVITTRSDLFFIILFICSVKMHFYAYTRDGFCACMTKWTHHLIAVELVHTPLLHLRMRVKMKAKATAACSKQKRANLACITTMINQPDLIGLPICIHFQSAVRTPSIIQFLFFFSTGAQITNSINMVDIERGNYERMQFQFAYNNITWRQTPHNFCNKIIAGN